MLKLREIPNLINFRTYVNEEILDIDKKLIEIRSIYDRINSYKDTNEIKEGSRVRFSRGVGDSPVEGRVVYINKGKYAVNRDGYAATINAQKFELENLSIGYVAELERQIWVLEHRMAKIKLHFEDAEIPEILQGNKCNFIHVIDSSFKNEVSKGSYEFVTFISSKDKLSYKLKVPTGLFPENGYYQVEMEGRDIKRVLKSTNENFERSKSQD